MYCPKCGIQNNDETKFCSSCGENLKVVSQAMTSRLPAFLVRKMDAYIERRNAGLRRESIGLTVLGCLSIFLGFYDVLGSGASWGSEWFNVAFGCFMLLLGLWDHTVYKRSLSLDVKVIKRGGAYATDELPRLDATQIVEPPASVAESTTKQLDAAIRGQRKP